MPRRNHTSRRPQQHRGKARAQGAFKQKRADVAKRALGSFAPPPSDDRWGYEA